MGIKAILFVLLGLVASMTVTAMLMRSDLERMEQAERAQEQREAAALAQGQQQPATPAPAPVDPSTTAIADQVAATAAPVDGAPGTVGSGDAPPAEAVQPYVDEVALEQGHYVDPTGAAPPVVVDPAAGSTTGAPPMTGGM